MRFSTVVLAVASLVVAQQAGVNAEAASSGEVVDGHLHLLSRREGSGHGHQMPNTRRHHMKKSTTKKRGYCKAKSGGSNSTSSASSSSSSSSGSDASANADYVAPSSSSSSSSAAAQSTASSSSNSSDGDDDVSPIASSGSSSSSSGSASSLGSISAFQGTNSGIGSWFRTDSGSDSTNGMSWCQTKYQDSWMGFAPSVGTMLSNFGGNYQEAAKAYCGRTVKFTNPNNGKTATGFIADGFDDKWVRTPGSVDLTLGLFEALYGSSPNGNKNIVIQNLQWEFDGGFSSQGTFQSGKYSK